MDERREMITIPPEVEKQLVALAEQRSVDPASLIASLVAKEMNQDLAMSPTTSDEDIDPNALSRAIAALNNRSPEQIKAAQDMALREFTAKRELPAGAKTIFDVIPEIRGHETDEQVAQALQELS